MQKFLTLKIFTNINENIPKDCLVTIGIFDGVHLGHRFLLQKLVETANDSGKPHLVITLWPHPGIFFGRDLKLLNTLDEKINLFSKIGIENLLILNFTNEISGMSTVEFSNLFKQKFNISAILKGYNNSFGSKSFQKNNQIAEVETITLQEFKHPEFEKISSTRIRNCLNSGDILSANKMLGYEYCLSGEVISGYKIGRKLGFPTANIGNIAEYKLLPKVGVYAVKVKISGEEYIAMLNIGYRPSFGDNKLSIEFHIPGFNRNIYGEKVEIIFHAWLRDEIKYQDINELIKQLERDKNDTLRYFNN